MDLPRSCRFKDGETVSVHVLRFEPIRLSDLWGKISATTRPKFSLRPFAGTGAWVSIPTFAPTKEEAQELTQMISHLHRYRGRPVVLDLRQNTGGSSSWRWPLYEAIYSKELVSALKWKSISETGETYEYRVSEEAARYVKNLIGNSQKNIETTNAFFSRVSVLLDRAVRNGEATVKISLQDFESKPSKKLTPPGPPLVVVTDELCFSACLSFMDIAKAIPGTIHIGRRTSADAVFMQELDEIPLADGLMGLTLPILRVHNRRRGHNEPYVPDIQFDGDISKTEDLEPFVAAQFKRIQNR